MARRFFLDHFFAAGDTLLLSHPQHSNEIKHMSRVLRLTVGEKVILANQCLQEAKAEILTIHKDGVTLLVQEVKSISKPEPAITLIQGILKGPRMDWLVEKLTELQLDTLIPVISQHVVAADTKENSQPRQERWQRISLAALKQSGASSPLTVTPAQALTKLELDQESIKIYFSLKPASPGLGELLKICKGSATKKIYLAIGPEGGFSPNEEKYLENQGFLPAGLGQQTLRAETASIVACALARDWIDFWRRYDINN